MGTRLVVTGKDAIWWTGERFALGSLEEPSEFEFGGEYLFAVLFALCWDVAR
jgi:hypothetical protein